MSKIKDLLGDMTLEEFEVKRKAVLSTLGESDDWVESMATCLWNSCGLYDMWLGIEGRAFAIERQMSYGDNITTDQLDDYTRSLVGKFKEWLEKMS